MTGIPLWGNRLTTPDNFPAPRYNNSVHTTPSVQQHTVGERYGYPSREKKVKRLTFLVIS